MTLNFNPMRAVVMTHIMQKNQGQRSVDSKDRVETNIQPPPPQKKTDRQTDRQTRPIAYTVRQLFGRSTIITCQLHAVGATAASAADAVSSCGRRAGLVDCVPAEGVSG